MLTLITPTHDRQVAFDLCERWMAQQDYGQPYQWIVIDDGETPTQCRMGQEVIRLPTQSSPYESFRHNYIAGLQAAKGDRVVFIEDDDYYHRNYLTHTESLFSSGHTIVGQGRARYYNVRYRRFRIHKNEYHASLCQTGIHSNLYPLVIKFLENSAKPQNLDVELWRRTGIPNVDKRLELNSTCCTAIKGLFPSRTAGLQHTQKEVRDYTPDPTGMVLRSWMGSDSDTYLSMKFDD